jgi:mannose/cellobiose epimerase-like protein (N-acyl-D-glucosamine 2-epimerase family)
MSYSIPSSLQYFDIENLLRDLPRGERWLRHLREDLLPFWTMTTALGEPLGNFPTYRNNDGSLVDWQNPHPEFQHVVDGIVFRDRDHVRSKARQCFAYGVAYHMTGEEKYLNYAKAGVAFLREKAIDRENGGAFSYFSSPGAHPGPDVRYRTSQDMAYLLSGIGFLYYLTRDPELEKELINVHDYIWKKYYDFGADLFRWVLEDGSPDRDKKTQQEFVAQLDQIYGYMLLVTPCLPESDQLIWKERLVKISHIMMDRFYSPRTELFWGAIDTTASKRWGSPHTDFGHSVKAFWLISLIGSITEDYEMFVSAQRRAAQIVDMAYLESSGSWARCLKTDGTKDEDKEWWAHCELDQVSGALALNDPAYLRYIVRTYDYWFKYFVDHEHKEIWHMLSGATHQPAEGFPKQHSWKNALHSFEHALIGYIFAQQLHGEAVTLYYAWQDNAWQEKRPQRRRIAPYFYQGTVTGISERTVGDPPEKRQTVSFTTIH